MKDKIFILTASAIILTSIKCFGIDLTSKYTSDILEDPLFTKPNILNSNVPTLPNETGMLSCSQTRDLSEPFTLLEAVDFALCNNKQISMAWINIKIQAAQLGQARSAYLPTLSLGLNRVKDTTTYPKSNLPKSTLIKDTESASAALRLFDFGGRSATVESANLLLQAAISTQDSALQNIVAKVVSDYFDTLTSLATLKAKRQNEVIAKSILELAKRRAKKGASSQSDILQAVTSLSRASLESSRAKSAYEKAVSVLAYDMGAPLSGQIIIADSLNDSSYQHNTTKEDLSRLMAQTKKSHPAILAAREKFLAAKQAIVISRSEGMPNVDLSLNYYQNGRPNQGLSSTKTREVLLGINLSIPILEGFNRTYKIREAQAKAQQRETELGDIEQQVLLEVLKSHSNALSASSNLSSSKDLLSSAIGSLEVSKRRYNRGAADMLELLSIQNTLEDAKQERIRCLAEWYSARLQLLASLGVLNRSSIGSLTER